MGLLCLLPKKGEGAKIEHFSEASLCFSWMSQLETENSCHTHICGLHVSVCESGSKGMG